MTKHNQNFLRFEAVLAHCECRVPDGSLLAAMDYGKEMEFFDANNSLSESGELLADIILPTILDW